MQHISLKSYILDLRDQRIGDILPQLIKNIDCYFNDYNVYKEDGVYSINCFESNIHKLSNCLSMKFIYTEPQIINKNYILNYSLNVLLDYNESYYNRAEILQLIYSLFNSINIYGIMEG